VPMPPDVIARTSRGSSRSVEDQLGRQNDLPRRAVFEQDASSDPSLLDCWLSYYQDACSGAVARYDGFVAKFMGDGVLAYFGFQRAHEEDAERAGRAGLASFAASGVGTSERV
jgi:class 3 adenylate cyclase